MKKHYIEISLFLVLLLAAFLRLYHIGFHEVWYDEARSIATAQKDLSPYSFYLYFGYKPLYFLILKLWIYLWGVGAVELRLLSVIFGITGVFLVYKVGEVSDGKRLGLISAS